NKIDLPSSKENVVRIRQDGSLMVPVSAEAELALRRAVEKGLISYRPGDPDFSVNASAKLSPEQKAGLEMIRKQVLAPEGASGDIVSVGSASVKLLDL